MADKISVRRRSENMRRIKSKNMKPELLVRRLVHGLGYRYRLHKKDLPGKPDLVFAKKRQVIFVNGCFWHQHKYCREGRLPNSRHEYWIPKLVRNVERDKENIAKLKRQGWHVLVLWECEIEKFLG
jgi:DNA mismatch endonuclease (patch repair protein)